MRIPWLPTARPRRPYAAVVEEFRTECTRYRPLWERRVAEALAAEQAATTDDTPPLGRRAIEARLLQNSAQDLARFDAELSMMQQRTNIILTVSTLLFAALSLWPATPKSAGAYAGIAFLSLAWLLAGGALCAALQSTGPNIKRAWGKPYDERFHRSLLAVTDFEKNVLNCWLAERMAPIVASYKKVHAIAIPMLVVALVGMLPGITLSLIFR